MSDLERLWKTRDGDAAAPVLASLDGRVTKLEREVRRDNLKMRWGEAFVVCWFGVWAWIARGEILVLSGCLLTVAGTLVATYRLREQAYLKKRSDFGAETISFYRQSLTQQRDFYRRYLQRRGLWVLPGLPLILIGQALRPGFALPPWLELGGMSVYCALVVYWVWRRTQKRADTLQRELDNLGEIETERF